MVTKEKQVMKKIKGDKSAVRAKLQHQGRPMLERAMRAKSGYVLKDDTLT